jgi:hypothetical protein
VNLRRIKQTPFATYGRLSTDDGIEVCVTLELPWQDNKTDVSCIPAGTYHAVRWFSPRRGYELFILTDVPNREAVEIHPGNLPHDSHGCILVGSAFGDVNGEPGITGSKFAFQKLMTELKGTNAFLLGISDVEIPAPPGVFA